MAQAKQWQRYLAEVFGTFTLVFGGSIAILASGTGAGPFLVVVPLAFGLALLAGLYAFGEVSGGHFNPAVSLGAFLDRRIGGGDLIGYWVSQFVGAIVAALFVLIAFNQDAVASTATVPGSGSGKAFVLEVVFTAIFIAVILQVTKSGTYGGTALIAIPLTLTMIHLAAVPFSGSSVNPARTFGPALIGNEWKSAWIYYLAPPLGAILGWMAHAISVKGQTSFKEDLQRTEAEARGAAT
jgi:aquaporin Z